MRSRKAVVPQRPGRSDDAAYQIVLVGLGYFDGYEIARQRLNAVRHVVD